MTDAKGKTATRAAILEAAKKIFAAKGFGAATVRDICTEAGANTSTWKSPWPGPRVARK